MFSVILCLRQENEKRYHGVWNVAKCVISWWQGSLTMNRSYVLCTSCSSIDVQVDVYINFSQGVKPPLNFSKIEKKLWWSSNRKIWSTMFKLCQYSIRILNNKAWRKSDKCIIEIVLLRNENFCTTYELVDIWTWVGFLYCLIYHEEQKDRCLGTTDLITCTMSPWRTHTFHPHSLPTRNEWAAPRVSTLVYYRTGYS